MAGPSTSDFPGKVADFLDDLATKIRGLTVDRVASGVTWTAVGIVMATLVFLVVFWFLVGVFRAAGTLIGQELAYVIAGILLVILGVFFWSKRFPKD